MQVLLIDNEHHQLDSVKKSLSDSNCQLTCVDSVVAVIETLVKKRFDLIISPYTLPQANGEKLLKKIKEKFPSLIRLLILNEESVSLNKMNNLAHYVFQQSDDLSQIRTTIEDLTDCKKSISKKSIVNAIASVKTLPSPPKVYMQLNALLKEANVDSQKISDIISQDPALAAKVLQFSNNSFKVKGKSIQSISDAITKMGVDALCCIVMTAELFSYEPDIPGFSLAKEQLHSLAMAKLASSMVKPELRQEAMIAGLLHDIGKLVLYEMNSELTKKFMKNRFDSLDNTSLEKKVFGSDHCHVGGYLLHLWSFPYAIIEAVVLHHTPEKLMKKSFGVAQAVFLADKLLRNQEVPERFIKHYKLDNVLEKLEKRAEKLASN